MNDGLAQRLADMICRRSPIIADGLGLPLTGPELAAIYEIVGKHYLREKITHPFIPTVADLLQYHEHLDQELNRTK